VMLSKCTSTRTLLKALRVGSKLRRCVNSPPPLPPGAQCTHLPSIGPAYTITIAELVVPRDRPESTTYRVCRRCMLAAVLALVASGRDPSE
jgi:hypothetical protein